MQVKFLHNELRDTVFQINEAVEVTSELVETHPRLTALRDVFVTGTGYYNDLDQELLLDLHIEGTMIVPCAISLNPVDVDFDIPYQERFVFGTLDDESDGYEVESDVLDLQPYLDSAILADVPLKVVDPELEAYPEGEGWAVMTEEAYIKEKSREIDPRLAILKDFKID